MRLTIFAATGGIVVSRADVAHLMLRLLSQPETVGKAIGIAN